MTLIAGINIGETRTGIELNDGACSLMQDGIPLVAIAEDRVTRKKYDSGFKNALHYCLDSQSLTLSDVDLFVFSNCCDLPLDHVWLAELLQKNKLDIPKEKLAINPSHHLSHAMSAFYPSAFKKALIIVADNEGNVLDFKDSRYWLNSQERTSLYLGNDEKVTLYKRFHANPRELGIGGVYNYITRWIGYDSYQEAGKTMALAAYGKGRFRALEIFNKKDHHSKLKFRADIKQQVAEPGKFLNIQEDFSKKVDVLDPGLNQIEAAWLAQREVENVLIDIVKEAVKKTHCENLCVSGGVGLNCVANYKLLRKTGIKRIFVQPAAGDSGQCLGNCLYGQYEIIGAKRGLYQMAHAYLGREYDESDIMQAMIKAGDKIIRRKMGSSLERNVAGLLLKGKVVAWFQGGSEFGPRALGHRSLLVDPRSISALEKLKRIKKREYYRPFAPSVLESHVSEYFEYDGSSPFMLLAVKVRSDQRARIPAAVHVDGTARIQTVNKYNNDRYFELINSFYKLSGLPMVLNTSLNRSGEPLVETPENALAMLLATDIDYLAIGNYLVEKK